MIKLTQRQTEFLQQFLELYQKQEKPLHYSTIAEELNVQKGSAYEMLRHLEKLGLLYRKFQLPDNHHGPGRATVYFLPTEQTLSQFLSTPEQNLIQKEWDLLTTAILEKLSTYRNQDYRKWISDLAEQFSHNNKPFIYATKMVTAIVVSLASLKETVGKKKLVELFNKIGISSASGLTNLAGVGLALSLLDNVNSQLTNYVFQQNAPFQEVLITLEDDKKQQLSDFANEAFKIALS
ncbi:MAG: hypothetical protein CL609_03775 [Anaerolineaceae bacterium]|nr:hypothetical protein [Anaerolineaceae bacterium]